MEQIFFHIYCVLWASLVAQRLKRLLPMQETRVWSLGWEDPLEKEMVTHSSILAWGIPWTEEPGRLQSTGSQRVGHDWATSLTHSLCILFLLLHNLQIIRHYIPEAMDACLSASSCSVSTPVPWGGHIYSSIIQMKKSEFREIKSLPPTHLAVGHGVEI